MLNGYNYNIFSIKVNFSLFFHYWLSVSRLSMLYTKHNNKLQTTANNFPVSTHTVILICEHNNRWYRTYSSDNCNVFKSWIVIVFWTHIIYYNHVNEIQAYDRANFPREELILHFLVHITHLVNDSVLSHNPSLNVLISSVQFQTKPIS